MDTAAAPIFPVTPAQAGARHLDPQAMGPRLRGGDAKIGGSLADRPATRNLPTRDAEVARQFETLIAETLLRSARAARLGDDGLGAGGDHVRNLVDHQRAEAVARAAPLGIARLLQRAPK